MWIELGRKIMTEFVTLRFSYIIDVVDKNKKSKRQKKVLS